MSHDARMTRREDITKYLSGDHALFTLVSKKTGEHLTYRLRSSRNDTMLFVDLLTGSNNESDYTWIGMLFVAGPSPIYRRGQKSEIMPSALGQRGIAWFTHNLPLCRSLDDLPVEFWHSGTCSRCGRTLTDEESIATGMGPVCRSKDF